MNAYRSSSKKDSIATRRRHEPNKTSGRKRWRNTNHAIRHLFGTYGIGSCGGADLSCIQCTEDGHHLSRNVLEVLEAGPHGKYGESLFYQTNMGGDELMDWRVLIGELC